MGLAHWLFLGKRKAGKKMRLKNHLLKLFWQSDFILPEANVMGDTNVGSIVSRKEPEPCSLCQSD